MGRISTLSAQSLLPALLLLSVGAPDARAQDVTMPLERYHELHQAAHPEAPEPAVPLALEEVALTIRLPDGAEGPKYSDPAPARITQDWTFTVAGSGWQRLPLPVAGTFLSADLGSVDGLLKPAESRGGQAKGGWTLTLRGEGRHRMRLESAVAVAADEGSTRGQRSLELPLPVAAVVHGSIEAPPGSVTEVVAETGAVVVREGPGRWSFSGEPGAVAKLLFLGRRHSQDRGELPLAFEAVSSARLTLGRTRSRGRIWLRLGVLQGRMETVTIGVPAGLEVTDVQGEEVGEWRPEGDTVVVDLRRPRSEEVLLTLLLSGPAMTETVSPVARVPGAWRARRIARVEVEGDGFLTLADPASGRPPAAEDLERLPGPQSGDPAHGIPLVVMDPDHPPRWNLFWGEATDVLAVQVDRLLAEVMLSEAGRAYYRLGIGVRANGVAELDLIPPPGFQLTEAWNTWEALGTARRGDALVLPLDADADEDEEQLLILEGYLPLTLPTDGGRLTVPLPQASAPIARVSVRLLLPGGWSGAVVDAGRRGSVVVPTEYELLESPPGFWSVDASWSALSPNPAPLDLEIDHDRPREEWF